MTDELTPRRALSRRCFLSLTGKVSAGMALVGCECALQGEDVWPGKDAAGLTIIDTHTHCYDPTRPQGVPWPPKEHQKLYRTVPPKDYRALPVPRPVTGTVVVEASPWVEDNQWVLDVAAQDRFIVGVVGNLPAGTKQFSGHLKRFAGNELFRGIRLRDRKLDGTLDDPAFVSDLKLLAGYDLSLDLVGGREILQYADRLAGIIPDLRIIIDHLAGVTIDGRKPPAGWEQDMRSLVRRAQVYCKISGLVSGTGRSDGSAPADVEFYRPVLDAMFGMFGPKRLMFGSDWPVSELYAPLGTVQRIVADYVRSRGRKAEEQVFAESAHRAYRWISREKPA